MSSAGGPDEAKTRVWVNGRHSMRLSASGWYLNDRPRDRHMEWDRPIHKGHIIHLGIWKTGNWDYHTFLRNGHLRIIFIAQDTYNPVQAALMLEKHNKSSSSNHKLQLILTFGSWTVTPFTSRPPSPTPLSFTPPNTLRFKQCTCLKFCF